MTRAESGRRQGVNRECDVGTCRWSCCFCVGS